MNPMPKILRIISIVYATRKKELAVCWRSLVVSLVGSSSARKIEFAIIRTMLMNSKNGFSIVILQYLLTTPRKCLIHFRIARKG